ncbi:TonB-dependent receptor plug domain-containing protein [Phenylobacterium deserti]|uniref:TonB-dependent receptor plug domain-containing protein n=1 Tax=Phenylobacterium deserti TaxID=1914756 RepID=UPI001F0BF67D|nr:TonB-dependent receptor [Phenylobacterium deserti]
MDEVIVTGTRSTARTVTTSLAPIDVLSAEELQKSGKQSTRDLIATFVPSANVSNSGAGASFAFKTVSLRGLSGDQTLLLVNGKRRHNTAVLFVNGTTQNGQSPPDLDLIPSAAIERIEVLRDGASAQYGSDALAGVINIILKEGAEGGALTALAGLTGKGDGETAQASANAGFGFGDTGYLNLTLDARTTNHTDRGYKTPNQTQLYFPVNGQPDPREASANRETSHPGQPQVQLYSLGFNTGADVGDLSFYAFGTVSSRNSAAYLTFRNPNSLNNNVSVYPDGYTPRLFLKDRDYQVAAGVRGRDLLSFNWDLSTTYGSNEVGYYENSLNASLGPQSPTYFYLGTLTFDEWTTNFDLNREFEVGLAKPLFLAMGLEYRDDTFAIEAGELASYVNGGYRAPVGAPLAGQVTQGGSQGVTGFPPFAAGEFSRDNKSAYINVEQAITDNFEVSLAGRYESYSDFGETTTGKVSARWEPIRNFAVRGTVSSGFRAPSLQQQHYGSSSTIGVSFPTGTVLYPVQLLPPDNPAAIALGAKPLEPESSTSYSLGFVSRPLPGLSLTLDVYQIEIKDRIMQSATLGPNTVVSNALASQGLNPQQAVFYYANAADTTTQGVDFVGDYAMTVGDGRLRFTFTANYTKNEFDRITAPPPELAAAGLVLVDRIKIGDFTVGTPRDKEILSVNWVQDRLDVTARFTRFGEITQRVANPLNDETVSPTLIVDLDASVDLTERLRLTVGANNLFDVYPDTIRPANRGNPPFSFWNQYAPWGISGGFYYTRLAWTF